MTHAVWFRNRQKKQPSTPALRALVKKAVRAALEYEKVGGETEVSVLFTDDEGIRALNAEYRGKDEATDVLSFPVAQGEAGAGDYAGGRLILGDIVLSLERAAGQAAEYGHPFEREVAYLCVHSVLHLLGYDHMTADEKADMRRREEEVMRAVGLMRD